MRSSEPDTIDLRMYPIPALKEVLKKLKNASVIILLTKEQYEAVKER